VMSAKSNDTERKSTRTHTVEMSWKVLGVDSDGSAEITQRIERIRIKAEAPPFMPFEFDSATSKAAPPGFEAETQQLKAQVGAEFGFKMKPNGEIQDIKVSEQTLKALREAAPRGAQESEISEKAIKDVLLQSSPPSFPEGALEPGKTWAPKPAQIPLGFATLVMEKTFTYQGADPKSPNLMLVGIETAAKIEPVEGSGITASIRKQEGKGSMTFDGESGRVGRINLNQKVDMVIVFMGQSSEQSTEMTSSMSLLP
jgi:hypothetical protein